jgi:hypothetical protein
MNTAIVRLLDRELPEMRGIERDELAAKIMAVVAAEKHGCSNCRNPKPKKGRTR